jgi:hypothetical protein
MTEECNHTSSMAAFTSPGELNPNSCLIPLTYNTSSDIAQTFTKAFANIDNLVDNQVQSAREKGLSVKVNKSFFSPAR